MASRMRMMMTATGGDTNVADKMVGNLTKQNSKSNLYKSVRGSGARHENPMRQSETAEEEVDRMLMETTQGTA